jgi:hypothetical protein
MNFYQLLIVEHDEPFLAWSAIAVYLPRDTDVLWDRQGESRLIPASLIAATREVQRARYELSALGRERELPTAPLGFTRDQTVPWLRGQHLDDVGQVTHHDSKAEPHDG